MWKAFKQLARRPSLAALAHIYVWNPRAKRAELFELVACPFGARNVVWGFNWLARGLQWVLAYLFLLAVAHYFDDFPQIEPSRTAVSAKATLRQSLS